MKKVIPAVIVLVAIVAAALVLFKKVAVHHVGALDLAPSQTLFFLDLPDLRQTAERWPRTALAQIGDEPEVREFLAKPLTVAREKRWDQTLHRIEAIEPGEAFVAVTSIEGNQPRFLAGFSFRGRKADVESLLAGPRATLKGSWPAGKSDVTSQNGTEIDTFIYQDTTFAEAFTKEWYLCSNDLELLRHTIDVAPHGLGDKGLGASDLYRKTTARLPASGEVVFFSQVASLTDRLVSLLVASGQGPDPKQLDELKKIQAVAWGAKLENALIRDTLFVLSPGHAAEPPLPENIVALSEASTFLLYSATLPRTLAFPTSPLVDSFWPALGAFQKTMADRGLQPADFGKAFGPEFGLVSNWPQGNAQPSTLLALDVRDAATAKRFLGIFTETGAGGLPWTSEQKESATIYRSPPATGVFALAPCLALTDRFLVIGFSEPDLLAGLRDLKAGKAVIKTNPAFSQAATEVVAPTSAFAYLDLQTLFERGYGTLRPLLAMSLAFAPDSAKYVDVGKLPSTAAISKHLSPAIYSQAVSVDGTLVESVGPLTLNDVLVLGMGGAVAAAWPQIENTLTGGLKGTAPGGSLNLPPALGLGRGTPAPSTPAPAPATPPVPSPKAPQL